MAKLNDETDEMLCVFGAMAAYGVPLESATALCNALGPFCRDEAARLQALHAQIPGPASEAAPADVWRRMGDALARGPSAPADGPGVTAEVLRKVAAERQRQKEKWGDGVLPTVDPNCLDGKAPLLDYYDTPPVEEAMLRSICDLRARVGRVTFADVLLEEVAELFVAAVEHGDDSPEAEEEAVQVSAVGARIAECILRRRREKRAAANDVATGGRAVE